MLVRQLMTGYAPSCEAERSIAEVQKLMLPRDRGPFPVLDRSGHVIGMLTGRDIRTATARLGRPASRITVREAISELVPLCHPQDDVRDALRTMRSNRLRRLAVVDSENRLLGAVCLVDPGLEDAGEKRPTDRDPRLAVVCRRVRS